VQYREAAALRELEQLSTTTAQQAPVYGSVAGYETER
jgi:hypothetical protein